MYVKFLKWSAAAAALLLLAFLVLVYREQFQEYWQRQLNGETHPAGLIAAYVVLPMIGFPIMPLLILLGVRFGALNGSIIMIVFTPLHLVVSYWAVRTRIQGWIEHLAEARSMAVPKIPEKHRFKFSFLFMIIPGLSYTLKNYLLPMSGLSFPLFLICGWLPQAVMGIPFVVMGAAAARYTLILLAGMLGIYIVMMLSRRWIISLYHRFSAVLTNKKKKEDYSK
ncbi:TVP38/TMEM64 family protein [Desulfocicer niacini]